MGLSDLKPGLQSFVRSPKINTFDLTGYTVAAKFKTDYAASCSSGFYAYIHVGIVHVFEVSRWAER